MIFSGGRLEVDGYEQHNEFLAKSDYSDPVVQAFYRDEDDKYYWFDDEDTIVDSSDTEPDDTPLYQNQEQDPAVASMMFDYFL